MTIRITANAAKLVACKWTGRRWQRISLATAKAMVLAGAKISRPAAYVS